MEHKYIPYLSKSTYKDFLSFISFFLPEVLQAIGQKKDGTLSKNVQI